MGRAMVFCRPSTPNLGIACAGHVGWAFEVSPGMFSAGGVEATQAAWTNLAILQPGQTDFWAVTTPRPSLAFSQGYEGRYDRYDTYKVVDVPSPNVVAAQQQVAWASSAEYRGIGQNCMNFTYAILTAYGASLPDPNAMQNWLPVNWFANVAGAWSAIMDPVAPVDFTLYWDHWLLNAHRPVPPLPSEDPDLRTSGWNDVVSSLVVRSGTLTLYEDIRFAGHALTFQAGQVVQDLTSLGFNDQASSYIGRPR